MKYYKPKTKSVKMLSQRVSLTTEAIERFKEASITSEQLNDAVAEVIHEIQFDRADINTLTHNTRKGNSEKWSIRLRSDLVNIMDGLRVMNRKIRKGKIIETAIYKAIKKHGA